MKKNRHPTSSSHGSKPAGFERVDPPVELPSAEDFVCSDEEVREACEALCNDEDPESTS